MPHFRFWHCKYLAMIVMFSKYALKRAVYISLGFTTSVAFLNLVIQDNKSQNELSSLPENKIFGKIHADIRDSRTNFNKYKKPQLRVYERVRMRSDWTNLTKQINVCLATQASIDRLSTISEVVNHWQGPISLAVYFSKPSEWNVLQEYVAYLQKCSQNFRRNVILHLAVPIASNFSLSESSISHFSSNICCTNSKNVHTLLMEKFIPKGKKVNSVYPQNHMRNIARKACGKNWILVTDIDIIPSYGSANLLQEFYNSSSVKACKKCAFVIPTFELHESVRYPATKAKLLSYVRKGLARQFHKEFYDLAQTSTNYKLWSSTSLSEGPIKISHVIYSQDNNYYEPFYVSDDTIPPFDERFVGYGFTRSSQVLAARMRGWSFKVLTPVFLIHRGMKKANVPKDNSLNVYSRSFQNSQNSIRFRKFYEELKSKNENGIIIPGIAFKKN